jgi:hypothetical protein
VTFYALTLYLCAIGADGAFCVAAGVGDAMMFGECALEGAELTLVAEYEFRMSTGYSGEMIVTYGCSEVSPQVSG